MSSEAEVSFPSLIAVFPSPPTRGSPRHRDIPGEEEDASPSSSEQGGCFFSPLPPAPSSRSILWFLTRHCCKKLQPREIKSGKVSGLIKVSGDAAAGSVTARSKISLFLP